MKKLKLKVNKLKASSLVGKNNPKKKQKIYLYLYIDGLILLKIIRIKILIFILSYHKVRNHKEFFLVF